MTIDPAVVRKIETTGWTTVLLGLACVALAGVQAVVPRILESLAASLDAGDDPTRAVREAYASGAAGGALVNLVFGLALIAIGFAVARRVRWGHPALTIASWASIAALLAMARPSLAPLVAMAGGDALARIGGILLAAALLVAQVVAVLWFLRFWRRPEVRAAFR